MNNIVGHHFFEGRIFRGFLGLPRNLFHWKLTALLKYFRKKATILPNLDGPLSECMPSAAFFQRIMK